MAEQPSDVHSEVGTAPALAMGNGSFYKTLAVILVAGLGVIFGLGFFLKGGFGIFKTDGAAFVVAGLSIAFISLASIVLLWTLGTTLFRVRQHLSEAILLHEIIENNYTKLQAGTEDLRREVKELRALLADAKETLRRTNQATRNRNL